MTTRLAGGIALVFVVVSMLLLVVFQTIEVIHNRVGLAELHDQQETPLQEAAKVKRQFEALAAGIAELANGGDASAKTVVEELRRDGVILPAAKR
jgi:Na+-transporting methylmalonyl-CoA/oxaloacetate decarboxylase gamma subunit